MAPNRQTANRQTGKQQTGEQAKTRTAATAVMEHSTNRNAYVKMVIMIFEVVHHLYRKGGFFTLCYLVFYSGCAVLLLWYIFSSLHFYHMLVFILLHFSVSVNNIQCFATSLEWMEDPGYHDDCWVYTSSRWLSIQRRRKISTQEEITATQKQERKRLRPNGVEILFTSISNIFNTFQLHKTVKWISLSLRYEHNNHLLSSLRVRRSTL